MKYDEEKVDEFVLALLYLTSFTQRGITRAWKGQDWDVLDRLHEKGLISDPKGKAKSVVLSDAAAKESARLFQKYFAGHDETPESRKAASIRTGAAEAHEADELSS